MKKQGRIAAVLFCTVSVAGILTLFSQAEGDRGPVPSTRAMDLSAPEGAVFRSVLPAALEGSALPGDDSGSNARDGVKRPAPRRLSLR